MAVVTYLTRYPPIVLFARDGSRIDVHKRADGDWGWTKRRNGRIVGTNGQGIQRCRAIGQAVREAGRGATAARAAFNNRGQLVRTYARSVPAGRANLL